MQDASEVSKYINKNTKLIWTETPTNPMMNITDIEAVGAIDKKNNILIKFICSFIAVRRLHVSDRCEATKYSPLVKKITLLRNPKQH